MPTPQRSIAEWLAEQGMSEYADVFGKQKIDLRVLPELTDQDLRELGVALGDRRLILKWAAELRTPCAALPVLPVSNENASAERRQVTVLFCDLVDSTGLSRKLDPEDMREVIRAYQETVTKAVQQYDGFVAGFRGDGVLVYFGYPQAHEDDAERAVRAALDLIPAVGTIRSTMPIKTRVGIATGLVVVGDLIGSGDTQERNMVGDAPNLAARLLTLAEPNSVVISDETRWLLGDLFELEDLGRQQIKGIEQPVRVWAVVRTSAIESRFEAMHVTALTELIGRDDELELLNKRWRKARAGEGEVVLISGEPGIGKSRLTAALMESANADRHTRLRYFCSPQHSDTAFYPIISQMERAAGITGQDSTTEKLDKLDAMVVQSETIASDRSLLADLLLLPNDGRYAGLVQEPQQRRQQTIEALTRLLFSKARTSPILMIFEDVQWIDPTSLEAVAAIIHGLRRLPILLILTYRPEFNAPWVGQPHVTTFNLNRLSERDIETIIDRVCGGIRLRPEIIIEIGERSDGIPLFIEEMTKAVLEAGELAPESTEISEDAAASPKVPASLQASLQSRLDRLGPARAVAQAGAVIGRSFSYPLLAAVVSESDAELEQSLERLVRAGLLFRQGQVPHATYLFKHALLRDAAYGTLLRETRRTLHLKITEVLERDFPDLVESQPALLAHHAAEAGLTKKAAGLWGKAAKRSLERSALIEAVTQFKRAILQSELLLSTPDLRQQQIELQVSLAMAVMQTKGYAAPETAAAFSKARKIIEYAESMGETPNDPLLMFMTLYGSWVEKHVNFDRDSALALGVKLLDFARAKDTGCLVAIAHRALGSSLMFAGEFTKSREHFDQSINCYVPDQHRSTSLRLGQDSAVFALSYGSVTKWLLGFPDLAEVDSKKGLSDARSIGHESTLLLALGYRAHILMNRGDYDGAAAVIDEVIKRSQEKGTAYWRGAGIFYKGRLHALLGHDCLAIQLFTTANEIWTRAGAIVMTPFFLSYLALSHARSGNILEARDVISAAANSAKTRNENYSNSHILRIAGDIELLSDKFDLEVVEASYGAALTVAREQSAKSFELQAAISLARLWRDQDKSRAAYDLLAPVYNWFTEGFETRDLKEGKALLDDLGSDLSSS